jgi:1-acyl-sn-glycerol-3-phosphate acyltransferase
MARILRTVGCFPVDRSRADSGSAREAVRRLRAGHCVVIFPEAGIRLGEKSVLGGDPAFKPGAGLIAELSHATILPVIVRDTRQPYNWRNWLRRARLSVTFGHPFCLWQPGHLTVHERRTIARTTLRDALLKTVQLD